MLAGPTAVGKGTICRDLLSRHGNVWLSVSATTREPRPGEVEGEHYFFVTPERFDELVEQGQMLEWAWVHGKHRYGTPRGPVEERLAQGAPVLLEIDLDGARQVRKAMPSARLVFVAPPSREELIRRLVGRGTEGDEERARRLATAETELAAEHEFDTTIVNDDVRSASGHLAELMGIA